MALKKRQKNTPVPRARAPQNAGRGQVFSYHANRSVRAGASARQIEEPTPKPAKRIRIPQWRKHLPTVGALVVILIITILCLNLGNNPKVVTVGPTGGQVFLRDRKVYEQAAKAAFTPALNGNKLTVNTGKISADLERQFPELKVVSVSLPFIGSQPIVYIQPAKPALLLVNDSGSFVLDSEGRALIGASQVPDLDALHIPVVTDQSNLSVQLGSIALPGTSVSFVSEVVGQLAAKGITPSQLVLPSGATELQAHLNGVGYYVRFNLQGNAREEAGTYLATKQYLEGSHKTPSSYVDVRVENKAYYK